MKLKSVDSDPSFECCFKIKKRVRESPGVTSNIHGVQRLKHLFQTPRVKATEEELSNLAT